MTRQEVVEKMGDPDRISKQGQFEILVFEEQGMSGFSIDRQDYSVILESGKVVKYGAGSASISKSGKLSID